MTLLEILAEQVRARPDATAIVETRRGVDYCTSFRELEEKSRRVAALLRATGLQANEPVLIFHPMSADLYAVLLGVFRIGAVAVFLDPSAGRDHLERCCELQPPRALVSGPKAHLLRLISPALRRVPLKFVIGPALPGAISLRRCERITPATDCALCAPELPALLTFTSGSTGLPKAAVRTHGFLIAQHQVLQRHLRLEPGEVDLTTLPIFLLANLASGVTSVIPNADLRRPGFIEGGPVLEQMARQRVTRVTGSPAFFERLLAVQSTSAVALSRLRKIHTGGAPVFPKLLRQLHQACPEAAIEAVYGSTEAEPIAHVGTHEIRPEDQTAMAEGGGLLAGRPIPEINLRIINDQWGTPLGRLRATEFAAASLAPGGVGEIVVSGGHVLKGYHGGRGDQETKFSVEDTIWHRPGDAGRLDSEGRLWLLGRCEAKVEDAHGRLYPFAVECAAQEYPGVGRAAFVQHNHQRWLAIEPGPTFTAGTENALHERFGWAGLDRVVCVEHLPVDRRHNAKIEYPALRRLLEGLNE